MTPEELKARARRAEELLNGASWVFDEVVTQAQREWLETGERIDGEARREELFRRAQAALTLKGHLLSIVNQQTGQEMLDERRGER